MLRNHTRREWRRLLNLAKSTTRDFVHNFYGRLDRNDSNVKAPGTNLVSVRMPIFLLDRLQASFERRQLGADSSSWLQVTTDCFLFHLEKSNIELELSPDDAQTLPSVDRLLELLKCQFLIDKIKNSDALGELPRNSHWHGYVHALEEVRLFSTQSYQVNLIQNTNTDLIAAGPQLQKDD